jgi:bifunctional non-homologous end joining protein LigD
MGLEGVMAKKRDGTYLTGKRSESWLKIKTRRTMDCVIIGYTQRKGDRQAGFGALHIAKAEAGGLKYVGKVGTGFNDGLLTAISQALKKLTTNIRPVKETPLDSKGSVWVEPKLMCEVQYASITQDGMLREPVFIRLRPDLAC